MNIELISFTPDPEKHIEKCARVCYNSVDKITEDSHVKFLHGLMMRGHFSVIEHASATILISDVDRATTHQLVRHRHFSFSQQSQRYVAVNKESQLDDIYYIPDVVTKDPLALGIYVHAIETAHNMYNELLNMKIPKEDARFVLPNSTYSTIVVTGNFRTWLEFLQKRLDKHAQLEIHNLSVEIFKALSSIAPTIFTEEALTSLPPRDIDTTLIEKVA